jgi:serine phosphatase RsbU (regulator of sigma subunit)
VLAGVEESQVLPKLQQVLVSERHDRSLFTTVCTAAITVGPEGDSEALVRLAGHPPPVSLLPDPRVAAAPVGLPLGILPHAAWESATLSLDRGWALLMHTDGLIEGRGPVPGQPLWEEGLLDVLAEERDTDLEVLPARLVERAVGYNGGPLVDDVAILLLSADASPADASPASVVRA